MCAVSLLKGREQHYIKAMTNNKLIKYVKVLLLKFHFQNSRQLKLEHFNFCKCLNLLKRELFADFPEV